MLKATHASLNVYMKTQMCLTSEPDLCTLNTTGVGSPVEVEGCLRVLPVGLFLCTFLGCMGNQKTSLEYLVKFHLLNKIFLVNIQVPLLERKTNACPELTQVGLPF